MNRIIDNPLNDIDGIDNQEIFITAGALAKRLIVSRQSISTWIKEGKIKALKIGRCYRITKSEEARIMREGIKSTKTERG